MICDFVILNHLGCDFDFKSFQEKIFGDFDFKISFSCTILILNQIKNDFTQHCLQFHCNLPLPQFNACENQN
jgi:hypothetical protein